MLHDPSHYEPPETAEPIVLGGIRTNDSSKNWPSRSRPLRPNPSIGKRPNFGDRLNDPRVRAAHGLDQRHPRHEMDVDGQLTLKTQHPWAQSQERELLAYHLPVAAHAACPGKGVRNRCFVRQKVSGTVVLVLTGQ